MKAPAAPSGQQLAEALLEASRVLLAALEGEADAPASGLAEARAGRDRAFAAFEDWIGRGGRMAGLAEDFRPALRALDARIAARAQAEMERAARERAELARLRRAVAAHRPPAEPREARFVALRA